MSLRKRFILGVLLSALVASWAYYAEYLPFTGKWIASYRMERYAKEQYPGMRHDKVGLNPCYNCYTTIFSDDSGREVLLNCSWHGWISDDLREDHWISDSGADETLDFWGRVTNVSVYLTAMWHYDRPKEGQNILRVTVEEYDRTPLGEAAARRKLAESLLDVWDTLPETARAGITDVKMGYHCLTEEDPENMTGYYAELPVSGGVMTEAQILPMIQLEDAV